MERPILFSTPMIRAILEGRKSQTRRIVKKQPHTVGEWIMQGINWLFPNVNPYVNIKCPYGKVGDVLWVRETFSPIEFEDGTHYRYKATFKENNCLKPKWKPSIFMPKEACRIKLEITDIRVERLQNITGEEALAEGISKVDGKVIGYPFGILFNYSNGLNNYSSPKEAYSALWEKINGKGSWESNPWVWVIEFKRIQP